MNRTTNVSPFVYRYRSSPTNRGSATSTTVLASAKPRIDDAWAAKLLAASRTVRGEPIVSSDGSDGGGTMTWTVLW